MNRVTYMRGRAGPMPPKRYATVNISPEARDEAQTMTLSYSARVGRRLSIGDVIAAALLIARAHPDELLTAVAPRTDKSSGPAS
jgi:hypothetical protein